MAENLMKQVLQNMRDGKTTVTEVPVPTPQTGQALVRVTASLVSAGTERMLVEFGEKSLVGKARSRPDLVRQVLDKMRREGLVPTLEATFNRLDAPMTLGYSSAGTITALGSGMEGFTVGQRVACAGGGYAVHAEYNLVPRNLLTPLPEVVDFESAAFTTLGAIALHGFRLTVPQVGERVAVIGLGLLGLLAIQIAAAAGCRVFGIDTNPARAQLARQFGLDAVSRGEAVEASQAFTSNCGFDSVIICADTPSNDPVELAGVIARDRARVVATGAVGLTFPRKIYYEKELSFINSRSYGPGRYDPAYEEKGQDYPAGYVRWTEGRNLQAIVELMENGKLQVAPLITHRFPIEQAPEAYEIITGKRHESFLGVLLRYPDNPVAGSNLIRFTETPINPQSEVRLGVLGAGLFANATLLPAIKKVPGILLVGIASASGVHAQHSGKKFGFNYACSDDDQILNDPNINTVAILTRHDSHADLVIRVLRAGKHVFVEKPLAVTPAQLEQIDTQLSAGAGNLLMTGFNRRFAPLALELSRFLQNRSEPLHVHYRINAGYIPLNHWTHDSAQGGRIIGEGCHFVDFISFMVGASPISVRAQALPDRGKYHEDNVSMTFTYPDGSLGVVDYLANGDKSFAKERVEVFCGGRIAVLNDYRELELVQNGNRKVLKSPLKQDKGHLGEMQALVNGIREGTAPIPFDQLAGVARGMFAAVASIRSGGEKQDV
jgi:predicted dehydrogenase/threonine dehydrogenase-like Zn-dependent dehydrogenase